MTVSYATLSTSSRAEGGERPGEATWCPGSCNQRRRNRGSSFEIFNFECQLRELPVRAGVRGNERHAPQRAVRSGADECRSVGGGHPSAAMPRKSRQKTLLAIFDAVSGKSWKSPEAAAIAARLVRLLPQPGEAAPTAARANEQGRGQVGGQVLAQHKSYWWIWLGFALIMSFMTPHHPATTTNAGAAMSDAGTTSHCKQKRPGSRRSIALGAQHRTFRPIILADRSCRLAEISGGPQNCTSGTAELGSCLTDATRDGRSRRAVREFAAMRSPERLRAQSSRPSDPVVPCKPPCLTREPTV